MLTTKTKCHYEIDNKIKWKQDCMTVANVQKRIWTVSDRCVTRVKVLPTILANKTRAAHS